MKRKILILGSTGLLGNQVSKYFFGKDEYDVITTYRDEKIAIGKNRFFFDAVSMKPSELPLEVDYVINCIGIIKPFMADCTVESIMINSLFPHHLASACAKSGSRLIHITTDCVYSGSKGKYVESDVHDALDAYGKSKSLGECCDSAMVLRTSIIGEEIHKNASLIEWAKSQKGKQINGFTSHLWNGVTTLEYAKICEKIIVNNMYERGLFHVFAKDDVSKYDMLNIFNKKFNLNLTIIPTAPNKCDRTLRSEKQLCEALEIPTVEEMVMSL